ncbi:MAG TPA: hypothetical protein VG099_12470 [Gemmataceae bacterium]|jgi:hypothetical protein|nr:hypothetical protein [Gemmataceae bacterium]
MIDPRKMNKMEFKKTVRTVSWGFAFMEARRDRSEEAAESYAARYWEEYVDQALDLLTIFALMHEQDQIARLRLN